MADPFEIVEPTIEPMADPFETVEPVLITLDYQVGDSIYPDGGVFFKQVYGYLTGSREANGIDNPQLINLKDTLGRDQAYIVNRDDLSRDDKAAIRIMKAKVGRTLPDWEDLEKMTVSQLIALCKERGISTYRKGRRLNKGKLLELLDINESFQ
jgi:hypothetical protein